MVIEVDGREIAIPDYLRHFEFEDSIKEWICPDPDEKYYISIRNGESIIGYADLGLACKFTGAFVIPGYIDMGPHSHGPVNIEHVMPIFEERGLTWNG